MTQNSEHLDQVFFALSDATRRAILAQLTRGSATIGGLAAPFKISGPAVTKHMKVLERAGLVSRKVQGREHHCTLTTAGLQTAEEWLTFQRRFWESRFDAIDSLLQQENSA